MVRPAKAVPVPRLQQFFDSHVEAFCEGRFDDMLSHYRLPLTVIESGVAVRFDTADAFTAALSSHHATVFDAGTQQMGCRVVALALPRNGRTRAFVDIYHDLGGPNPLRKACATYLIRRGGTPEILIEQVHYRQLAFPEQALQRRAVGRGF